MMLFRVMPPTVAIVAILVLGIPNARSAEGSADLLAQTVTKGQHLFATEKFGGNGKTCESCHVGGGKSSGMLPNGRKLPSLVNAAAIFPRYASSIQQTVTLEGQIRKCIQGGLEGASPDYGSIDLVALVTYLGSIAHGQTVDIGGAPK